jgi:hypothetical protein
VILAAGAAWLLWPRGRHLEGSAIAETRTTYRIGDRAVAVAEPGTSLTWDGTKVRQTSGDIFFRVDEGSSPFRVETPAGTVRVLGTCFRTEVIPMKASRAGLAGAALGATAATIVIVTVYEGKVLTASPKGEMELEAGQAARLEADRPPRVLAGAGEDPAEAGSSSVGPRGVVARSTADKLLRRNLELTRHKQQLEQEVETLQTRLEQANGQASKAKILDLDKEQLLALAKRCELRWDMPSIWAEAPRADSRAVKELGLTKTEQDAVRKVLAAYHRRMRDKLHKLYVEVTGDDKNVDSLSMRAITSEIKDKSPRAEIKQVFQRLARERAGLQTPPSSLSGTSAIERLYRLLTSAGDRVEKAMAAEIGPDLARRYRRVRDGFGSRSRSSYGCP